MASRFPEYTALLKPDVTAEAELIASIFHLLDRIGLGGDAVKIRVSSRSVLEETLRESVLRDRPEVFAALCVAIDKLDKIGSDAVADLLIDPAGPVALAAPDARFVVSWLETRDLDEVEKLAPADSTGLRELKRLFELLDVYGYHDRVVFDASIVRGLAYYTGVVFEAFDTRRELRAVCGGGRYDGLLETLGGPSIPAVGFGFGDVVITELLADKQRLPKLSQGLDAVVYPFGETERRVAVQVASVLRGEGQSVEIVLGAQRLKRVLADADKAGAREVYLIGPDELARGEVLVRDLSNSQQRSIPIPN